MEENLHIENERRKARRCRAYDPVTGEGCTGSRTALDGVLLPGKLLEEHPDYGSLPAVAQDKIRIRYDFEYWCARCIKIVDKSTGQLVPFILNEPQRRVLEVMERQRLQNRPVRVILLKARQWGGSTLSIVYIAWFQIVLFKGKNSVIVGHKRNSSFAIKQMLRTLISNYPPELLDAADGPLGLANTREATDIQELVPRGCNICLTSSYSPDSVRGQNLSLAHLSEVSFWKSSRNIDPTDLVRSIGGAINHTAGTVIIMESTANGTSSFFYTEWERARRGESAFTPVFVAWKDIGIYRKPLDAHFDWDALDDYERALWREGCTLEQIYWYHDKRKEYSEHNLFKAEFPGDDKEAFVSSMDFVFSSLEQKQITENVVASTAVDAHDIHYWQRPHATAAPRPGPRRRSRYLTMLTIGSDSDPDRPTVISVWNLNRDARGLVTTPELAASWAGNKPLNHVARLAVTMARQFDEALLVIENNDLGGDVAGRQQGVFVLKELQHMYRNLYVDKRRNELLEVDKNRYSLMFYELIINARNQLYVDRDEMASTAVARLLMHQGRKYGTEQARHFQYVVNRAEMLYIVRQLTMRCTPVISEQDKKALFEPLDP